MKPLDHHRGHSTAQQAAQIARGPPKAKSLYLIHYQVWNTDPQPLVDEAAAIYDGADYASAMISIFMNFNIEVCYT